MAAVFKAVRIVVSLLVMVLCVLIFIDSWTNLSLRIGKYLIDFQFIPSVLRVFVSHTVVLGGFIIILLITLLFGRLYCSFLCPLGLIQDMIIYFKKLFSRKKKKCFARPRSMSYVKYTVLLLVILSILSGSTGMLIWLDPYSITGRMLTDILKPVVGLCFNISVHGLNKVNYYDVLPVDWTFRAHPAFWTISIWFTLVLILSLQYGRLYCNSICPLGAFLGLLSKLSLYQIKIDEDGCSLCGNCVGVCKSACIDLKTRSIDFSSCVGCQNCIKSCSKAAITYNFSKRRNNVIEGKDLSRRTWLRKSLKFMAILPVTALKAKGIKLDSLPKEEDKARRIIITPPGSFGRQHFKQHCTACHLCISHCPTQVLQPSWLENSIGGMFQPMMDFSVKYCLYECNICTIVCPTGAILPLTIAEKKRVQPGRSRFLEHLCVVVTKGTLCGACSEHCPTKACDMVFYKNNLSIPKVDNDVCVGCGACEHACPTLPKSIIVDENEIHLTAMMPKKKVVKPLIDKGKEVIEEFPF